VARLPGSQQERQRNQFDLSLRRRAMIGVFPAESSHQIRRLVLTVRDPMQLAANPKMPLGVGCKSQSILRALRLILLFAALASAPCLAEEANNAGPGPVATVTMDHNTFIPDEIAVMPGTTVTWVNKEFMPHTVVDTNKGFRSKILAKDASFSFTFATAGEYDYLCSIHPNMKGKVIVKPPAS
jgi:plastocyanin